MTFSLPARQNFGYLRPSVSEFVVSILQVGPLLWSKRIFFDSGIELVIPTKLKRQSRYLTNELLKDMPTVRGIASEDVHANEMQ